MDDNDDVFEVLNPAVDENPSPEYVEAENNRKHDLERIAEHNARALDPEDPYGVPEGHTPTAIDAVPSAEALEPDHDLNNTDNNIHNKNIDKRFDDEEESEIALIEE